MHDSRERKLSSGFIVADTPNGEAEIKKAFFLGGKKAENLEDESDVDPDYGTLKPN